MILIIDDLSSYVERIGKYITSNGQKFIHVTNPSDFEMLPTKEKSQIKIILLDENMPEASGKEIFFDYIVPEVKVGNFPKLKYILGNSTVPIKQKYLHGDYSLPESLKCEVVGKSKIENYLSELF